MHPVYARRRLLDPGQRMDNRQWHALGGGKGEILQAALGLRAPIGLFRHCDLAEAVDFNPRVVGQGALLMS